MRKLLNKRLMDFTTKDLIKVYFLFITWVAIDKALAKEFGPGIR